MRKPRHSAVEIDDALKIIRNLGDQAISDGCKSVVSEALERYFYTVTHEDVKAIRGSARKQRCESCDSPAYDWALIHGKSPFLADSYVSLCRKCHKGYDGSSESQRKAVTRPRNAAIRAQIGESHKKRYVSEGSDEALAVCKAAAAKSWEIRKIKFGISGKKGKKTSKRVAIIGAGLTGATAAWILHNRGWDVMVYESEYNVGGQLRARCINEIYYEPLGAHIFHTSSDIAHQIIGAHGKLNSYRHVVKTVLPGNRLITWPPQVNELKELEEWPKISAELDERPSVRSTASFESYAIDLMGPTLYEWLCEGYTRKQWGTEPHLLSAKFAPKRLDLRTDDDPSMFRDTWQGWMPGGWHTVVESMLKSLDNMFLGTHITVNNLPDADAYIITSALDDFLCSPEPLPWRGVVLRSCYEPHQRGYALPVAVVNYPSDDVPYTRKVETKQMALQKFIPGTVVSEEYPGADARHYPVDDVAGENRERHKELVRQLESLIPNALIAGRLATYSYIDMDQSCIQGYNAARKVAKE